jgi:proteasome activator subunit 4
MIGDLSSTGDSAINRPDSVTTLSSIGQSDTMPSFSVHDVESQGSVIEPRLSNEEEDILLKDTTGSFADWVTSFVRRVIQLLENLPEESAASGASEGDVQFLHFICDADSSM